MLRRSVWVALALAFAASTAGCGQKTVSATVQGGEITIEVREFGFRPNRIVAQPGRTTFMVRNTGSLAHNLTIRQGDMLIGATRTFLRGTRRLTATLDPGRYQILCTVGHHADLGATGTIVVD